MRLICSVTPQIYYGIIKYERKYKKSNKNTEILKKAAKSSIMLGKLAIDFLAHYKVSKGDGYNSQDEFYDPGDPNWVEVMNQYKEKWVENIPLRNYDNTNDFKDSNTFKQRSLFDLLMNMRKLSDKQLESIKNEDEKMYWRKNVERFIDESTHMAYRLTKKMHEYMDEYGELEITECSYDWSAEGQKWLDGMAENFCKEEGIK